MSKTKQIQAFNAAAENFVRVFDSVGGKATQASVEAWAAMMKLAPERIRTMVALGASRDGTVPMLVTRPPIGESFWGWVYSPPDIYKRLMECGSGSARADLIVLLRATCEASGVDPALYPVYA
jgi:hypothetical protein